MNDKSIWDYDWDDEDQARAEAQVDLAYRLGSLTPKEERELEEWVNKVLTEVPF